MPDHVDTSALERGRKEARRRKSYIFALAFTAAASGVTFGRHLVSTGREDFTAQIAPSLGETNLGPLVGPVVITEIHYHPAPGGDEFVELKNVASTNVVLFDPERSTNTWKLNGLGYTFPPNLTLEPGQGLLLVATNPADFRARHLVPEAVPVLGPWSGVLQDSGERLELQRPDVPGLSGLVPFLTVDMVRYNDKDPWPTAADGRGPSLQRRSDGAYGNDPASWTAAYPTPGRSLAGGAAPVISAQPADATVFPGGEAEFRVVATGGDPLFYQWHCSGTPIAGATGATLTLTNLQPAQSGRYAVVVYNESGTAESEPAVLAVVVVATIVTQPKDVTVRIWPDPQAAPTTNATFSVLASGSATLSYQWRFNGRALPGASGTSLTITNVQIADAGDYDVVISNVLGTVVSAAAHLYPLVAPVFLQQPLSQTIVAGGMVTLSAAIAGYPTPLTNEWRLGFTLLSTHVLGDSLDFYGFVAPNVATTLQYRAFAKGPATIGGGTLSSVATITVLADADADGLPDVWEAAYGVTDPHVDADNDGARNGEEYQAGTNPTNAASLLRLSIEPAPGTVRLWFDAVSNRTYTVQYQDVLGRSNWQRLADFVGRTSNRVETLTTPMDPANSRFYRIAIPRQP